MNRIECATVVTSLALTLALAAGRATADDYIPGTVLVKTQSTVDVNRLAKDYNSSVTDSVPNRSLIQIRVPTGMTEQTLIAKLAKDARVLFAEVNAVANLQEKPVMQYHFAFDNGNNASGYINQGAYSQVHLGAAWKYTTGKGVVVAVMDTGATFNHPALQGHYLPGYNVLNPSMPPYDDPSPTGSNLAIGHGTMVAGIIARLAPDAKILPIRVLDGNGNGTMMDVAKGLHYAVANGAKVINMSFSAPKLTEAMRDALDEAELAGCVMVSAAGNDGAESVNYPAAGGSVISVTSIEADNSKSTYSNYGSFIRVVAPGSGITSTYWNGGYASWSGTSFAAPFVSAAAALMVAVKPGLTGESVRSKLRNTAVSVDKYNPKYKGKLGNGLIDIEAAVNKIR